jgi:hypothetical protein
MGWAVNWVSAHGNGFNQDFRVSFTEKEIARGGVDYNYGKRDFPQTEAPGISVFARDAAGTVYHTYSTYGRGVEVVMTTYDLLDLVPQGRDEAGLDYGMEWLRRWLVPAALFALTPKCVLCVLAYTGLGVALGLGGPELCGATAAAPSSTVAPLLAAGVMAAAWRQMLA